MHYFCHALNLIGEEAYITTEITAPHLRTPILDHKTLENHQRNCREGIAIYPEIVSNNPLNARHVVRYLLNIPEFINTDPIQWLDSDLIYAHGPGITLPGMEAEMLPIPLIDTSIYNAEGVDDKYRAGSLVFLNRYLDRGGKLSPITDKSLEISFRVPIRTPEELRDLYRKAELLYTYEPSTACYEAMLCGCPVVYLPNPINLKAEHIGYLGREGWAWGPSAEQIAFAKSTVRQVAANYQEKNRAFWEQLEEFVKTTQASIDKRGKKDVVRLNPQTAPNPLLRQKIEGAYQKWLELDTQAKASALLWTTTPNTALSSDKLIHLIVCLLPGEEDLLANTLDSLQLQSHQFWHLDILTPLPEPEGLEEVPGIGWHALPPEDGIEKVLHSLVDEREAEWVLELPPGTKIDPTCLWLVIHKAMKSPETRAFFVDDDSYDSSNNCFAPRFKPGQNPAALSSADLAGPLFVTRETWRQTTTYARLHSSPWFGKLMEIAHRYGWDTIKHIPGRHLSYPEQPPGNRNACMRFLQAFLTEQGQAAELLPVTEQSWIARHSLNGTPAVTVAIISEGFYEKYLTSADSLLKYTRYPSYEIILSIGQSNLTPDFTQHTEGILRQGKTINIVTIESDSPDSYAARCNTAIAAATGDLVVLLREGAQIIQEGWLEELVRSMTETDIVAIMPKCIQPGTAIIENAGNVLGLNGLLGSPYQGQAKYGDAGYLNQIDTPRDVSTLSSACFIVRRSDYLNVGGMDQTILANHFAEIELGLKLRKIPKRLIYQPLSNIVYQENKPPELPQTPQAIANRILAKTLAEQTFVSRWWPNAAVDPFWNPNLSLGEVIPVPETAFHAQWQTLPENLPRILAKPITNGQGFFRISSPIEALRRAGKVSSCIWWQGSTRDASPAELIRLAPDTLIVQNYLADQCLNGLASWHQTPGRPFTVYALDDLITGLAESNPLRSTIPPNSRERLKYALARCDRMVVSTEFLAENYRHLIDDIRVIPNRLEQKTWLPLHSRKRTANKPRIGWAGGTTHQDDLLLLKEIIEQTRSEADWIFMGMCPEEIRPLLTENHPFVSMTDYPAYLASLNLDIAVAPLTDIPFNRAKSNLRLLEYGMLSIPVVCTDIDPYRGSPACCVSNTREAWVQALRERIHDADAREQEGRAMRRWVQQNFLLENHLDDWLEAHLSG